MRQTLRILTVRPLQALGNAVTGSLRYKLLLLTLLPLLLFVPVILALAVSWSEGFSRDQLLRAVHTDLRVARDGFVRSQRDYLAALDGLSGSYSFLSALEAGDEERIADQLKVLEVTHGFDFIAVRDLHGTRLIGMPRGGSGTGARSPVLETAVHTGRGSVGIEVIPLEEITRMSPALEDRVRLALVDTPRTRPGGGDIETRAMVVRALQPVRDASGRLVALLDAGVVLNRNYAFVDRIRDLVYGPGSLPEGGWGAVSVLLGDTRITTNVPMGGADGGRALGTRMSAEVAERVLEQGETWIDRAFVVDDWYVSAYEPIEDVEGNRVGALYSGFLEAPYRRAHRRNLTVLLGLAALALALSMGLSIRGAESIFRPVEAMARVVQAKQAGRRLRVGRIASRDEIGTLARQLDALLDQLDQRNRQIQGAADVLEQKVRQRTHELSAQNIRLQETIALLHQTRRQLVTAEKLAALGELTAGVAHEINNPAAVILGNLEVVIDRLGRGAEPFQTELDLIIEQVYRIRAIVDRLLQYARPAEYANQLEEIDANRVVEDSLVLVRHELERKGVRLTTRLEARTGVCINRQELQQVLVNLLLNATRAVDEGGLVEVESDDWADTGVVIRVRDDGPGIPPDRLQRIFDPFFTTDPEHGSGLGLSVSYGLVARYGGSITVDSAPGQGACFNLFLRRVPAAAQDLPADECVGAG